MAVSDLVCEQASNPDPTTLGFKVFTLLVKLNVGRGHNRCRL